MCGRCSCGSDIEEEDEVADVTSRNHAGGILVVFSDIVIIIIAVKVDSSNVIDDGSGDGNVDDGDCDVVIDDDACGNVGGAIIKDDDS